VFEIQYAFEGKDAAAGVGGLGSALQPVQGTLAADPDCGRYREGIVGSQFFNEPAITRGGAVCHYDKVEGPLLGPMAL